MQLNAALRMNQVRRGVAAVSRRFLPRTVGLASFAAFGARGQFCRGQLPPLVWAARPSAASARFQVVRGQVRSALPWCFSERAVWQGLRGLPVLRQSVRGGLLRRRLVQGFGAQVERRSLQGSGTVKRSACFCHWPCAKEAAVVQSALANSRSRMLALSSAKVHQAVLHLHGRLRQCKPST
jgi:hypothetical protein